MGWVCEAGCPILRAGTVTVGVVPPNRQRGLRFDGDAAAPGGPATPAHSSGSADKWTRCSSASCGDDLGLDANGQLSSDTADYRSTLTSGVRRDPLLGARFPLLGAAVTRR